MRRLLIGFASILVACSSTAVTGPHSQAACVEGDPACEQQPDASIGSVDPVETPDAACVPHTCAELHLSCGVADDGCGSTIRCEGSCFSDAGQTVISDAGHPVVDAGHVGEMDASTPVVDAGVYDASTVKDATPDVGTVDACVSNTCGQLGITCGTATDNCGLPLNCGTCPVCVPKTCAQLGVQCGNTDDGCGKALSCGSAVTSCNDTNDCTTDSCTSVGKCVHTPTVGNVCTAGYNTVTRHGVVGTCNGSGCLASTACGAQNQPCCTQNRCDFDSTCNTSFSPARCDCGYQDGIPCMLQGKRVCHSPLQGPRIDSCPTAEGYRCSVLVDGKYCP